MILLDKFREEILTDGYAEKYLSGSLLKEFKRTSLEERSQQLRDILERPIGEFTPVSELYFRKKWAGVVQEWCGQEPVSFLEIASGDADMIPQALACCKNQVRYISANMNAALNRSLVQKTKELDINFQLIDDDAANIGDYIEEESVDIIGFQHGVNDVLQAILCGQRGIDTVDGEWMELLPKMIEILQEETLHRTFEDKVKRPFLSLVETLSKTLKKDGVIAINHYMFQLDIDMGYPLELFEYLVPMVRKWFREETHFREVTMEDFEPNWWIFLQK